MPDYPLTAERLREVLHYDPATGTFRYRIARGRMLVGSRAGCAAPDGPVIVIDRLQYRAARLAFLYMMGRWPHDRIDVANRNNRDLRWENLRPATAMQDHANQAMPRNSQTGVKGVWRDATMRRWAGQVIAKGRVYKRHFAKIEEAASYVRSMRERLHGVFACHG
jgi:hypothetical protein